MKKTGTKNTRGKSPAKSRSKSPKREEVENRLYEDEEIDEIIQNITLKRPRNAFTHYVMQEGETVLHRYCF